MSLNSIRSPAWAALKVALERLNRGAKGIADLDTHHKQLSQSAADLFAAIRDEAQIDVDHGNGTGQIIKQQVRTIREYLSGLERLADAITGVEGDRQDAYDSTPTRDWYSRGARNMRDRKYNQNHDPANGRFTSGDGGSGGSSDRGPYVSAPQPVTAQDLDKFEREFGVNLRTASRSEVEAALQRAADTDMGATDGGIGHILDLASHFGVKDPWAKSAKSARVPGAHDVYK